MAINHECYCVYGISGTAHAAVRGSMAGGPMEDFMELQEWKKMSWPGYRRENGSLGIRNKVLVVYTVECASHVAREIVRQADHPDVEVIGFGGCTDNAYAIRMLLALVTHPNVGAVLAVGLGLAGWRIFKKEEAKQPSRSTVKMNGAYKMRRR